MKKLLYIIAFTLIAFQGFSQTFCLSYDNPSLSGGMFSVDVVMSGSADYELGSSNLVFSFNDGALSSPTISSALLAPPFYQNPSITNPSPGVASINIELGFENLGETISASGTTIATITFNVDDSAMTSDYSWLYNGGTTQTVVFLHDEATQIFATGLDDGCLMPLNQVLPIRLRNFSATKGRELNTVDLNWASSTEVNGSHFEIERSQDLENWNTLGEVDAIGESTTAQEYNFIDDNLPLNSRSNHKIFYYRLRMVDKDGTYEYSEVRSVRFDLDGKADFLVYPNPAIDEVYVNLSGITPESGPATMNILSLDGQLVKRVVLETSDDIAVDISQMPSGVYYFMATQSGETFTQKVIKVD
ncbi:MAG: T9SS type A sorting domain-containing protein [Bacteroidota bacterium]